MTTRTTTWRELRRARHDLPALLAFRRSGLTPASRRRVRLGAGGVAVVTVAVAVVPAYVGDETAGGRVLALLPAAGFAFVVLAVVSAVASAGGRELLPRDQAVAFPVSSAVDHLGALLMAPLNIAWLLQAWLLLGSTAWALGPTRWWAYQLPVLLWVLLATALAQLVGWCVEGVRRGPHGPLVFRLGVGLLAAAGAAVVLSGSVTAALDRSPTRVLLGVVLDGSADRWWGWGTGVVGLGVALVGLVLAGAWPAGWALARPMREELRLEGGQHRARRTPRTELGALVRLDRASVWRSVPLRRGTLVLAVMPGLVALLGALDWRNLMILPGLVVSGGALLFAVNAWCLDGRGMLWRENLPVAARTVLLARCWVLVELLVGAASITLVLGALRAGTPTAAELAAVLSLTLVVTLQVVAGASRWSVQRPYAADLRSARATPAPPVVMVGYSARLALSTTVTSLLFSTLALLGSVAAVLLVALLMLLWSGWRLERVAQRWEEPVTRARVVVTVAG
ncbi:hypothetical protein [Nocardioides aurantiacus]|uniref:ABC-2 type transport system permease protein n=1 Tax=Nocardioides aurantiacus TaxID=86796 RepID=A0A3N2CZ62_9ACTN|nr:hypothetical protein [Nocardioides aurantiacus]ROR92829.1 hypothetical protein EDD33_3729 [Nocardioides aurantiacus]